jgi:hypothetical protein
MIKDKINELLVDITKFWLEFEPEHRKRMISSGEMLRNRPTTMTYPQLMTIVVSFHMSGYRNFKTYYFEYLKIHCLDQFPNLLSYNRIVELMPRLTFPLTTYLIFKCKNTCTGINFVDSTTIVVCKNQRIHNHKTFKNSAQRGKSSMGWFFGFKLHLIINELGEIVSFNLTPGNVDDRNQSVMKKMTKNVFGKLFGDKGYLSQALSELLFQDGIQLVTKLKKNMKNILMPLRDKILLRHRAIIETVNDELKNISQIEHTRHRSEINFFINLVSGLIAYQLKPKKPSLNITEQFNQNQKSNGNHLFLNCA